MKQLIALAVTLCVVLIGLGYYFTTKTDPIGPRLAPVNKQYEERQAKGVWEKGNLGAKVVLTEYADYQCPGCAGVFQILNEVYAKKKDVVKFEYRHFLLSYHNKATLAATASEAAGKQGKFWEMHDVLFSRQLDWADKTPYAFKNDLMEYAEDLGLNVEQFKVDMNDTSLLDLINKDKIAGEKIPVEATPTILINGAKVEKLPSTAQGYIDLIETAEKNLQ